MFASAEDQVNNNNNEKQYAEGYLGADALRSLPVATTIGNHDSGSEQYRCITTIQMHLRQLDIEIQQSIQKERQQQEQTIITHMEIHYLSY